MAYAAAQINITAEQQDTSINSCPTSRMHNYTDTKQLPAWASNTKNT